VLHSVRLTRFGHDRTNKIDIAPSAIASTKKSRTGRNCLTAAMLAAAGTIGFPVALLPVRLLILLTRRQQETIFGEASLLSFEQHGARLVSSGYDSCEAPRHISNLLFTALKPYQTALKFDCLPPPAAILPLLPSSNSTILMQGALLV
jgi:hypothetical protein